MIPVEINKKYTVTVDAVSSDGNGVARIDGFAVFIPLTAPGDTAEIQITKIRKRCAWGRLVKIFEPSPLRAQNSCAHYERCGGCQLRHIKYEAQLGIKRDIIENAMRRIGGFEGFKPDGIIGMNVPGRYRNKMIFHTNSDLCGFFAVKSHDIIPIEDCDIGFEENKNILKALKEFLPQSGLTRIFTRKAFKTGEILVVLSAEKSVEKAGEIVEKLRGAVGSVAGIIADINGKKELLWGKNKIEDILCGVKFEISPDSFFQVNPVQTEKLYGKVLEYANLTGGETVMDIYCGIGAISLCAAKYAKKVIGVEIVEQAVKDAKRNARINGIENAKFYAGSAENIVPRLINDGEKPSTIILDPPRAGSDEATLSAIIRAQPERIVYVSCNPATLARDARFLASGGYTLTRSCGFDLFPHTVHVETVCQLVLRRSPIHINIDVDVEELVREKRGQATYSQIKEYVLEHYGMKVSQLNIAQVKRKCGIIERENYNKPKSENARQPQCPPEKEAAIMDALMYFGMV